MCNSLGGTEADLTVTTLVDENNNYKYYLTIAGAQVTKDIAWIKNVLNESDNFNNVKLTDKSNEMNLISVQGPLSQDLLSKSFPELETVLSEIEFSHCKETVIKINDTDIELNLIRLTFIGELGYELHVPKVYSTLILKTLHQTANTHNIQPVLDSGYKAIDCLSAEKGYRHWHADLSTRDSPMEADIGFTVMKTLKQDDRSFIGKDALLNEKVTFILNSQKPQL